MSERVLLWVAFSAACSVTLAVTPFVRWLAHKGGAVAPPSADRWHKKPVALLGGIGIFIGFLAGLATVALLSPAPAAIAFGVSAVGGWGIVLSASLMFFVGLADDTFDLSPTTKLMFQGIAATILVSFGVIVPLTPWIPVNVLATMFWFMGLTNAVNLLDNMDGVASGVVSIAAFFLAIVFAHEHAFVLAIVCLALAGSTAGFLPYNFHPASIFMGDSGSLLIGALLAGLAAAHSTVATGSVAFVLFVPTIIVIIPILDTALVTVARTLAARPIAMGGRDHTSHRLIAFGLSERQVAVLLYGCAAVGGALAVWLPHTLLGLAVGALFLVLLAVVAAYLLRMHTYSAVDLNRPGRLTVAVSDLLHKRRALEVLLDVVLFAVAYSGAFLLRYDGALSQTQTDLLERTLAIAVACKLAAFGASGVYGGAWRRITLADGYRIVRAVMLGSLLTIAVVVFFFREAEFSRSVFLVDAILALMLTGAIRLSFRTLDLAHQRLRPGDAGTLIYGAGVGGELVVREAMANPDLGLKPIGFIDDDPSMQNMRIHGLRVLGDRRVLRRMVQTRAISKLVISTRKLHPDAVLEAMSVCADLGVEVLEMEWRLSRLTPAPAQGPIGADRREPLVSQPLQRA